MRPQRILFRINLIGLNLHKALGRQCHWRLCFNGYGSADGCWCLYGKHAHLFLGVTSADDTRTMRSMLLLLAASNVLPTPCTMYASFSSEEDGVWLSQDRCQGDDALITFSSTDFADQ